MTTMETNNSFEAVREGKVIIPTPKWFIALRVAQIVVSIIVLGLAAWWIHGLYYDSLGLAVATSLLTWIIALYAILSEKVASCRGAYNTWAILALDGVMIVFWLATLGSNAALRSAFNVNVLVSDCYDDGSLFNANHCSLVKRVGVATNAGLAGLSGLAGISAIVLLLFVATFAYVTHFFRLKWAEVKMNDPEKATAGVASSGAVNSGGIGANAGNTSQQQGVPQPQWDQQHQRQQQNNMYTHEAASPQYSQSTAHQQYPTQNTGYVGSPSPHPYQQVPGQPQPYSPHGTPSAQQPYQLPTQPN